MSIARHHAEWMSLVEASGPFLSLDVLRQVFPDGLDKRQDESELRERLHLAHDEWLDDQGGLTPDPAIHRTFVRYVLRELLELDPALLAEGQSLPPNVAVPVAEHGETLRPTFALLDPEGRPSAGKPRLLIDVVPHGQSLELPLHGKTWKAAPATRMQTLLHGSGVRLGLVTNGEHWLLVHAKPGETTSTVSFYASLWLEEPLTLRALASLAGARRLHSVPDDQTLEALFDRSSKAQEELTDQLGYQVRRAVELLIQNIDRVDRDRGRTLLRDVDEKRLYEAACTVMMRLVFLLSAEEQKLLLLGDPLYDQHYAVSTLRDQLQEIADKHGKEVLRHRYDAFARLLATFRAVHAGIRHERLKLPPYGGSLFDPDRYPFLEGRSPTTSWRDTRADPLPIDNLTVLDLLTSIQVLEVHIAGRPAEARRLSFSGLDVEQIGHVYEGLLDHTAQRAREPVVSLSGGKNAEPEVPVDELERLRQRGDKDLLEFLKKTTNRSPKTLERALQYQIPKDEDRRLLMACDNARPVYERVRPWAGLVRRDAHDMPVVYPPGSVYVTEGLERRKTGTHYTPPGLTEPIVRYTLEPLVYEGPAEGTPREEWRLRPARELLSLKICDLAMGSGAFLVQACRYLAERLVEAWDRAERAAGGRLVVTPEGDLATGAPSERPLPRDEHERLAIAKRIVADRCLYGVDKNPMAVEMAKLSLWLITLQKDRPFTFVDHALRAGDSLLGLTSLEQIEAFHIDPKRSKTRQEPLFDPGRVARRAFDRAIHLREKLESFPVESTRDAEEKARLFAEATSALDDARLIADVIVAAALSTASRGDKALDERLDELALVVMTAFGEGKDDARAKARETLAERAKEMLDEGRGAEHPERTPFHWVLEFPEVFGRKGAQGFDAFVGNPPFQGGQRITGALGTDYRDHLVTHLANGQRGSADLCAYFFLRAATLLRNGGGFGLLATNTIAQGDTREVGLDQLAATGFSFPRAVPSRPWPGTSANLEVAHVWGRKGDWKSEHVLDDKPSPGITTYLARPGTVSGKPYRLAENAGKSFQGSIVLGMGFVLTPEEAQALIDKNPKNRDVLFPYLNGQDLNSRPDQSPSRWVINFRDWPLDRGSAPKGYEGPVAGDYPDCLRIVEEKVKPERAKLTRKVRRERWWQFAERAPALYAAIEGMERVLALSLVNNHLAFAWAPTTYVFAHRLAIFAVPDDGYFGVLQSQLHYHWAWSRSSTMRRDINYSPTDAFDTFPFPTLFRGVAEAARVYANVRQVALAQHPGRGLTGIHNHLHDPAIQHPAIVRLRSQQVALDEATLAAYGWTDIALNHGFRELPQGMRFTVAAAAQRELLDRILSLNHRRFAGETGQDASAAKRAPPTKKSRSGRPAPSHQESAQAGFAFAEGSVAVGSTTRGVIERAVDHRGDRTGGKRET